MTEYIQPHLFVIWAVEAFWLLASSPSDLLWVVRQEGMLLTAPFLYAMTAVCRKRTW